MTAVCFAVSINWFDVFNINYLILMNSNRNMCEWNVRFRKQKRTWVRVESCLWRHRWAWLWGPVSCWQISWRKVKLRETESDPQSLDRRRAGAGLRPVMGVQGLTRLLENHHSVYMEVRFRRSRLLIDGCNLNYLLYFDSGEPGGSVDPDQSCWCEEVWLN